mmetsp:Transcript_1719/g.3695  ORF Transcript_1719/g.3695 Transcript_1719/m.3695 type:complete len:290 (-) Transcript_1719:310-1179(-)
MRATAVVTMFLASRVQRFGRFKHERVLRHALPRLALPKLNHCVAKRSCGTTGKHRRQHGVCCFFTLHQCSAVSVVRRALRAQHKRRPQLYQIRARVQRRDAIFSVHHPARRNQRHLHSRVLFQTLHQLQHRQRAVIFIINKSPAVSTSFDSLHDDGVHSGARTRARLGFTRGGGEQRAARHFERVGNVCGRKPKVEAHDFGRLLHHHLLHLIVGNETRVRFLQSARRLRAKLYKQRREGGEPHGFLLFVGFWRRVAEEVCIQERCSKLTSASDCRARGVHVRCAQPERP